MFVVTVTSQKGGVGKTTTAVSLASALPHATLVDLDPQGHCAISLGHDPRPGVFDWLVTHQAREAAFTSCVMQARPDLTLLPGDSRTRAAERIYSREALGFDSLVRSLQALARPAIAPIIVDTAAGGLLQEAALAAADVIVVPVRCELLGLDGVHATLALARHINPNAKIIVLPTGVDKRLREHAAILADLRMIPDVTHTPAIVPARVAVAEAVAYGSTIWEHNAPGIDDVRQAYLYLIRHLIPQEQPHG